MNNQFAATLSVMLFIFPSIAAETNREDFKLGKGASQTVPSITNDASASGAKEQKSPDTASNPHLKKLAIQSLAAGDTGNATRYAGEWLNNTTNSKAYYYGSHVHDANQIMGLAALKEGRITDAKNHLLKAGAAPASPQMRSFGPRMVLAQELLEHGEKEAVLEYLDLVAKYWADSSAEFLTKVEKRTPGSSATFIELNKINERQIELWEKEIQAGKKPRLNNSTSLE